MRHYRRNADVDLRELERRAAQGDQQALDQLVVGKIRSGRSGDLTLAELGNVSPGIVPPGLVAHHLREIHLEPTPWTKDGGHFVVRGWLSEMPENDDDYAGAPRIPIKTTFGVGDNDQIMIESPNMGEDDSVLLAELSKGLIKAWLFGVNEIYQEGTGVYQPDIVTWGTR